MQLEYLVGGAFVGLVVGWIIASLNETIEKAETAINTYNFSGLANALYKFFWTDLCDWYLEISKSRMEEGSPVQPILLHCIKTSLKLPRKQGLSSA